MRKAAVFALFLLTACGSSSAAATQSPSPSAAASPSASASPSAAPSANPSPVAALPCKMPGELRNTGTAIVLGWLTLPAGTTTDDTALGIQLDGQRWVTDHSPQLYGNGGAAWSNALNTFIPVEPAQVAPDGIHYAFLDPGDGKIHLANAQTQGEIAVDNPFKLTPIAYTAAGVVLTKDGPDPNGLWLLDPSTQLVSAITPPTGNDYWAEVSNGYGWGLDSPGVLGYPASKKVITAQIIPNPQIINPPNTATVAYTAPAGVNIANFATDAKGGVLILLSASPGLVYLPPGGSPTSYQLPPGVNVTQLGPLHHADAHGIWFTGNSGVFLFSTTTGLAKIAGPVNSGFVPAGDCV